MANTANGGKPATRSPLMPRAPAAVDRRLATPGIDTRDVQVERRAAAPNASAKPGVEQKVPRHSVLYMRSEPTAEYQPIGSFEQGNADDELQGEYLFESIRAERINTARARGARVPYFLVQSEEKGLKVED